MRKEERDPINAFEMRCYRRILRVSLMDHITNETILQRIGEGRSLLSFINKSNLRYFGHMIRADRLECFLFDGYVDGKRGRGRPRRVWKNDGEEIMETSGKSARTAALEREGWRSLVFNRIRQPSPPEDTT